VQTASSQIHEKTQDGAGAWVVLLEIKDRHICGNILLIPIIGCCFRRATMTASTSIRIDQTLYNQARTEALAEHRTIAGQVEYWAKVGRAALDNPDLPVSFIAESLASMAEPRSDATEFVPRSRRQ
jgi:hypothetical protein